MILLVVLMSLGLPSILAPPPAYGHAPRVRSLIVAAVVVAATLSLLSQVGGPRYTLSGVFYLGGLRELATWMPVIAVAGIVLIGYALVMRRRELAGALAVLILPWTFSGVENPFGFSVLTTRLPTTTESINTGLCVLLAGGLLVSWIADLHRPHGSGLSSSGGLDRSLNLEA
jgi:hypothetical protein